MNVLVLSDNLEVLARAKPIFEKRNVKRWTFTDSDSINPQKDWKHIFDNYDLVFSLHCKKIFPKVLTDSVRCVNIHPGHNPHNRGMFPHVWSIINKKPAGVTIHEMNSKIDAGPIIYREEIWISDSDTSGTLYNKIIKAELLALDECLDFILDNSYATFETDAGNYNSIEDFKKLCELTPDVATHLRALSHDGYLNAHCGNLYFTLHTHTKDENINHTHTRAHTD